MKAFNLFDGELDLERRAGRVHLACCCRGREARSDEARREPLRAANRASAFPYHYEYGCEEWLIVVAGGRRCATPRASTSYAPAMSSVFPEGPAGAHQVRNDTDEPVRVLIFSTKGLPNSAVYPDSGKIGIWTGNEADPPRLFRIGNERRLLGRRRALETRCLETPTTPTGGVGVVSCGVAWLSFVRRCE